MWVINYQRVTIETDNIQYLVEMDGSTEKSCFKVMTRQAETSVQTTRKENVAFKFCEELPLNEKKPAEFDPCVLLCFIST